MKLNGDLQVLGVHKDFKLEVLVSDPTLGSLGSAPRLWVRDGAVRFFNGTAISAVGDLTAADLTAALDDYSTTAQMNTAIGNAVAGLVSNGDLTTALEAYSTTTQMNTAISDGISTALVPYSTTTQMQAAIDNALAGLDFQSDVLGLESDFVATAGRYIYVDGTTFSSGVAAAAGDIVVVDASGVITAVAYDVSAAGPGALVWNRATGSWFRWDGSDWAVFGGLSGFTAGNGLQDSAGTVSVKAADSSIVVDATGVKVGDLSATYTTVAVHNALVTRLSDSFVQYSAGASATTHNVAHNIGNRTPLVQVIDKADYTTIVPDSITYTDTNNLVVALGVAADVIVNVAWLKA